MTAIVTGGAGAIGQAVAGRLSADGCRVVLVDMAEDVEQVADRLPGAVACVADITAPDAADRIAAAASEPPSLLVNNAGITRDGRAARLTEDDFRAVIRVNLVAPLRLALGLAGR